MEQLAQIIEIFGNIWSFISHGGWVIFVILAIYVLYDRYMDEIKTQWGAKQEWIFLNIRVPRENQVSTLGVEQIFAQMHALHSGLSFAETYVEGKAQLWYSLEIVSLGGKISFIMRVPKKARDLVEAAFYSQYPNAEISEVDDYLKNVAYDPDTSDIDIWGTEFKLTDNTAVPVRTYRDFEHPTAEEKIVDPLRPLFEGMTKIAPHELYAVQILIRPLGDDEWRPKGEKLAKELMGEKTPSSPKLGDLLLVPFNAFASFSLSSIILPEAKSEKKDKNFSMLSDMEKEKVNGILRKISKPGYKTKIRHLYVAPKDKTDGSKKGIMLGAFRTLGSANTNKFKPDTKNTWTSADYVISPTLEAAYLERKLKHKKKNIFTGFKKRSFSIGIDPFILNIEEIATIYHLPIVPEQDTASPVESITSKTSQPPANLPIASFD